MATVSIGVDDPVGLRDCLDDALRPLLLAGARCTLQEVVRGNLHFLVCHLETAEKERLVGWRRSIVGALSGWIIGVQQERLLRRLVRRLYGYVEAPARDEVVALVRQRLGSRAMDGSTHQRITERLSEYLASWDTLIVDGFVTFRLQDYVGELVRTVERVAEGYLLEREQRAFLAMLRQFVLQNTHRPAVVHCVFYGQGFRLESEAGHAEPLMPGTLDPRSVADIDEALTSALVALAPLQVVLHLPARVSPVLRPPSIRALEEVFEGGVSICTGCVRCQPAGR